MLPRSTRLPITLASWLIPRPDRAAWKRDWTDELEHRTKLGASPAEVERRAWGSFRDALFIRRRSHHSSFTTFLARPFRAEAALLVVALFLWLGTGAYRAPEPPFPNAGRAVIFERDIGSLGIRAPMVTARLVNRARELAEFETVAAFRFIRATVFGAFVSRNFFDVLGAGPVLGRGFQLDDPATVLLITDNYWRDRFDADPGAIGQTISVQYRDYEIIGILPPDFRFLSRGVKFFAPLPSGWRRVGAVGLVKPGASVEHLQTHLRAIAYEVEPSWKSSSFRLSPFVREPNRHEAVLVLILGLVAFAAGSVFLLSKGIRLRRCYLWLAARLTVVLAALIAGDAAIARLLLSYFRALTVVHTWLFLAVCTAAVILVVRDHLTRCPVCMRRLEHPASLGTWASMVVDPPVTEYACPAGHGLLLVEETGKSGTRWTKLDESWKDLFVTRDG